MTIERFSELVRHAGPIAPKGVEAYLEDLEPAGERLLPHELLEQVMADNKLSAAKAQALRDALAVIEADGELVALAQVLCQDMVRALNRCTACELDGQPRPVCLTGFARDAYAFLYALSCVAEGRRSLRRRGVPEKYDADIPERMIRNRLRQYEETGSIRFDDYPWDMNFYCCAIFLMDRFYFIPYRTEYPDMWREKATGRVVGLWPAGAKIRRDGQLDGVNGIHDPDAVTTVWQEDENAVTANPVDPDGTVLPSPVTLRKAAWVKELGEGDYLLALHIPGGEGYTPERVKSSAEMALAFYRRYFPEIPLKGLWSESWLYDAGLVDILGEDSRIVRVQRQFYRYPCMEGDEMHKLEVFGDAHVDLSAFKPASRLQRGLIDAWKAGRRFHTTGMFVLLPEVDKIGSDPYRGDR